MKLIAQAHRAITHHIAFFLSLWTLLACSAWGYLLAHLQQHDQAVAALQWIAVAAFFAALGTAAVSVARGPWRTVVKAACLAPAVVLAATYSFLWFNFEMNISPHTATLLAETNPQEAGEFITAYWRTTGTATAAAITVAMVAAVALAMRWRHVAARWAAMRWGRRVVVPALMLVAAAGALCTPRFVALAACRNSAALLRWEQRHHPSGADLCSATLYSLHSLRVNAADVQAAVAVAREVYHTPVACSEPDSLIVIFVLGESYIKHHAGIYGYPLDTTPRMERERRRGNLFVFTDVIAPYNATSVSEKNAFACNSMSHGEFWYEKPSFATVFRHAGFRVFFWDMQRDFQLKQMYTITVNAFLYNDTIAALSYDDTNAQRFMHDGALVHDFSVNHRPLTRHNLIMFHLMGQHVHPVGRYPSAVARYNHFTADSITARHPWLTREKRHYIATYDNATRYNDEVMGRIFDLYRDRNTVVLYFSDHGDEAYDYRDMKGRYGHENPDAMHMRYQLQVPCVVWCSDTYQRQHPAVVEGLRRAVHRPFMIDNACHVLFHLAGISTPYYIAERDPMSTRFKPVPRIVYYRHNYDAVMRASHR